MQSKHVPEVNAPSRNEQLTSLRNQLLGNQYFAACRGKLHSPIITMIDEMISGVPTPKQFNADWEELSRGVLVMGNLLAQYRRDGWEHAEHVLAAALKSPVYHIPGETVAIERTVPVTLIMPDPDRTLFLLNGLMPDTYTFDSYEIWLSHPNRFEPSYHARFKKLIELFPALNQPREEAIRDSDWYLVEAYKDVVLNHFPKLRDSEPWFRDQPGLFQACDYAYRGSWGFFDGDHDLHRNEYQSGEFLFTFLGEQEEALSHFSREEQRHLGSWQLRIPRATEEYVYFGLHPESEHEQWKMEFPSLVSSRGLSHKYGAVGLTDDPCHPSGPLAYKPTCVVEPADPRSPEDAYRQIFRIDVRKLFGEKDT